MSAHFIVTSAKEVRWRKSTFAEGIFVKDLGSSDGQAMQLVRFEPGASRRPAVERIGENTMGAFSDVGARHLPNGWTFGLPNELFLTERGTSFDRSGIPPTIAVPTLKTADLAAGRDPGLDRAIAVLSARRVDSPSK